MPIRKKSRFERLLSFNQHRKRKGASDAYKQVSDVDFSALKESLITGDSIKYTHGSSKDIQAHISALRDEFSGHSELLYHHAQLIVYIRREYKIKNSFAALEALWEAESDYLLTHLNTRWLVSAADTFVDHSDDPLVKALALNVSILVNTVKLNETERFLQDEENQTDNPTKFTQLQNERVALADGMSAFAVGTDDTLRNMRWRLNDVAQLHPIGAILLEVFNRMQNYETVFKRFRHRHTRKKTSWWG